MKYDFNKIEKKWQDYWENNNCYKTDTNLDKPKLYVLDMFPYPSGEGIHVGHLKGYVATDIYSRYKRLKGFNVLHPMGWDAFGLPAENYAIKHGIHPKITTKKNIDNIKRQMMDAGLSYDWDREINTTDKDYYKWTQWIFVKLFENGLAYKKMLPINWCPSCKTGLANEEVVDGKCERCGTLTTKKDIDQWVLKITDYAEQLLDGLDDIDWPDKIKEMQKNWIGKSEGFEFDFKIEDKLVSVFTTRIDTLFGCTYLVLSPEHPLVDEINFENKDEVSGYIEKAKNKSERERIAEVKDKTGVELKGIKAINPINGKEVPVFIADYVLSNYGTGAIMAVPAHDERDYDFAKKYNLEITEVVKDDILINSSQFNGLTSEKAKEEIGKHLGATKKINYKLRDWLFSRQRYWGEPIPIINCSKCGPVVETNLPLELPEVEKYEPTGTGDSPLAGIESWVNVTCPKCGGNAKRETNTMPQWAGSCWYYFRYLDNKNDDSFVGKELEEKWLPVDLYVGGAEHAVLHLLYARFWHKFLFNIGYASTKEPFYKLRNIGLVLAYDGQKMSKSKGNVVSPDEVIKNYGADTLRIYEMFMGPFEQAIQWNEQGLKGVNRFLNKLWGIEVKEESSPEVVIYVDKMINRIENELEKMKFNTPIAFLMEFIDFVSRHDLGKKEMEKILIVFSVFAPHFSEELWERLGNKESILKQQWPNVNLVEDEEFSLMIQVNGKLRDKDVFNSNISKEELIEEVKKREKIKKWIDDKEIEDIVYVPKRLINIVLCAE
ncbi:MAG: leucine--tRNA ligase [Candidatus Pacebacteria bacterium]|nr:leucine--tRNA ligase [Candidatus Paceibacterota bacterium]MDD2757176.1 leucine--tRNA ligase [Candidatus Paceibacterota bacterium]MDD3283652.1 leucine--tRNA ligase [Candidatus Paceibacterota bacterium]MDD3969724.1 leucine--tRNA ligase [Candidatus Paceibacterota bacterium]MDD4737680.1 leucine--tRNA ligase [Candidatus Paceibacterota bacterium]